MTARTVRTGFLRTLAVVLGTAAAVLVISTEARGAREIEPAPDARVLRLATVTQQRDSLTQRVRELEARLRIAPPIAAQAAPRGPTVHRRWTEPSTSDDVARLRLCTRLVDLVPGAFGEWIARVRDLCGESAPAWNLEEPAASLAALFNDELFVCWIEGVPRGDAPACLERLADQQPGAITAFGGW